jgi:quinol monooxygenase YgiN
MSERSMGMIVVVGRVRTDAERRETLIGIGQKLAAASRTEAGCISYRLCEDSETANEFLFVEEWENDEALQQHFRTAHIAEFMGAVPSAVVAPPDVKFHEVASSRDLSNVSGSG